MFQEITVIGNVGNDATVNDVNGKKVTRFSVAHTEKYKNREGVQTEKTTWFNCNYWEADKVAPYLKKGTMVMIKGTLDVSTYKTKQGETAVDIKINVQVLRLLSRKDPAPATAPGTAPAPTGTGNDDLPF